MSYLVERLAELRRHLDHLRELQPRVTNAAALEARLPGFRNILIHEYVGLDYDLVMRALDELEPIEEFLQIVLRGVDEEGLA